LDTVVYYRKRYLESVGKEETNKKFLSFMTEVIFFALISGTHNKNRRNQNKNQIREGKGSENALR
jgi:hypothetical protein